MAKEQSEEIRLTIKQKAWAEYYVDCGNKTKAAILAGYSERSAHQIGEENSRKLAIRTYIRELTEKADARRIAKAEEVLEFLTKAMRGEIKDQFGLDPTLSDRIDAAKQLQKRYGLDKLAVVGGEKNDQPIKTEPAVQVYLPDNGRD
jgi:phage terminase small subunit